MSFFTDLYNKLHPAPSYEMHSTPETAELASQALHKAQVDYKEARQQEPQVAEVVAALRAQRERNHFGELLEASMIPRRIVITTHKTGETHE